MLACAPLTCLLCFLLPSHPTHASGSLLILQLVSDWLAAPCGAGYEPSLLKCLLLAGHAGCAPLTCIPRCFALSPHMQFFKDKTSMKSAFVCPVGWGGTLCGTPTKTGPARTAPLHPLYNTKARSTFCCSQEPFNCLLASRSWPIACQAFFSTQPSIHRSANAQIRPPQTTPIPHRVDIEATVNFYLKQHKTASDAHGTCNAPLATWLALAAADWRQQPGDGDGWWCYGGLRGPPHGVRRSRLRIDPQTHGHAHNGKMPARARSPQISVCE